MNPEIQKRPGNRRVLFVDDETRVLDGLRRQLVDDCDVTTADSGAQALALLRDAAEPFAVIVSDERMPVMSGAMFLSRARGLAPNSVRMLLTGQTELKSAIDAVNEGNIFRFLCKPCAPTVLKAAIEAGIAQHSLIMREAEIMERTLAATVKTLGDVLSLAAPELFNRASIVKQYVSHVVRTLRLEGAWQIEVAASLHTLGLMALPSDLVHRAVNGLSVTPEERRQLATHPATAQRILSAIPRLEEVAAIVEQQLLDAPVGSPLVCSGARLLRLATLMEGRVASGSKLLDAIEFLLLNAVPEDRKYVDAFRSFCADAERMTMKELFARDLAPHMLLEDDVKTRAGALVVPKGRELNAVLIERLRQFADSKTLQEPIRVRVSSLRD